MPLEILPDYMGGHVKLNHHGWLVECHKLVTNKASTCNSYYHFSAKSTSNATSGNSSNNNNNNNPNSNRNNSCSSQSNGNESSNLVAGADSANTRKRPHQDFIDIEEKKSKLLNNQPSTTAAAAESSNLASKIEPLPFNN